MLNQSNYNSNVTYESIKFSECVGTPLYLSPEQANGQHYNEKADIYAMGVILYEMCSSFKTVMHKRESLENLRNNHIINPEIERNFPSESNLIKWMTNKKPSDRPTAQSIIESDAYKELKLGK